MARLEGTMVDSVFVCLESRFFIRGGGIVVRA